MTLVFKGSLDEDNVPQLIEKMEAVTDENNLLYFSSDGGFTSYKELLVNYLNQNKDKWSLVCYDSLYSNGFDVYLDFKGDKQILEGCIILLHLESMNIESRLNNSSDQNLKRSYNTLKANNKRYIKRLSKIGVSKKLIKTNKTRRRHSFIL